MRRTAPHEPLAPAAPNARWSIAAGAVAFACYALLAPHVSGDKDASEFALVLATVGAAHPTGYPLYTLGGSAFVHALHALGIGWDLAANLWSGLGGAVAIGLIHAFAARLLAWQGLSSRDAAAVAILPAAAFAIHPLWVDEATLAEVNSWHGAWTAGAALCFICALAEIRGRANSPGAGPGVSSPAGNSARTARLAAAWGLIAGAGLAHHLTSILTTAPLTLALLFACARAGRWHWRLLAIGLASALLPLASYAYIAWRAFHPAAVQWETLSPDWKSVTDHITGAAYRLYLGHFAPDALQSRMLAQFLYPCLVPGLALLAGWALRARGTPAAMRAALAAAVAIGLAYAFSYGVPDPSSYFLAPLMLTMAIAAAAMAGLPGVRRAGRLLAAVAALGLAVAAVASAARGIDRAGVYRAQDRRLHEMWLSIPYERGFVVWNDDMYIHLRGYQIMRGEKPGLEIVRPVLLTHPGPRHRFLERNGFDPVSRAAIDSAARVTRPRDVQELSRLLGDVIAAQINERSPLPVGRFDPEAGTVRLLQKPAGDSVATPRPPTHSVE